MIELSAELKKIETLPGAFDIIRYLGALNDPSAFAEQIMGDLDMSERRFNKAIRRLVTTGYVQMGAPQEYRLTDDGTEAAEELSHYDQQAPGERPISNIYGKVRRRMVVALPRMLVAGQPANMHIGFHPDSERSAAETQLVLRFTALNAQLSKNDELVDLDQGAAQCTIQILPSAESQMRVRVQVFQLDPSGVDIRLCGGMYVDIDVASNGGQTGLVAYGADIYLDN